MHSADDFSKVSLIEMLHEKTVKKTGEFMKQPFLAN